MLLNDEYYMQQALREAQKAFEEDEIPIGAHRANTIKVADYGGSVTHHSS